jgi:hypothetical protein
VNLAYPTANVRESLSDSLAKCHRIDTSKNEFLQAPLFQGKVGFHENYLAQSKPDRSYVAFSILKSLAWNNLTNCGCSIVASAITQNLPLIIT